MGLGLPQCNLEGSWLFEYLFFDLKQVVEAPNAKLNRNPTFLGRGTDRKWGFGASYGSKVREETGWLSPPQSVTAFRLSSMVIGRRSRLLYLAI